VTALLLLAAFVLIVAGAIGFTNAVEWIGSRLGLGQGAVGGLLAAVGTALPESLIPVVALLSGGGKENTEIAIGAVIGAPFLLGTLAMLLVGGAAMVFQKRREDHEGKSVDPHQGSARRDLHVFLATFPVAVLLGVVHPPALVRYIAAALFLAVYIGYAIRSAKQGGDAQEEDSLKPLFFDTSKQDPPNTLQLTLQFIVSLGAIIGGAELFVNEIEKVSKDIGVTVLILSLVLAPLATELPEKANSVLWVREGKDELAIGNITGAMVFQATVPVALLLVLTTWHLSDLAVAAAVVGYAGAGVALWAVHRRYFGGIPAVIWTALLLAFGVFAVLTS
jgi:cation:H+ antiporter